MVRLTGRKALAKTTHTETWWETAPQTVIRCGANYVTTGERCRSVASPGALVCDKHGARLPAVRAAAATRLGMSGDDAARKLIGWMNDDDVPMRERIQIAHDILDRGGLSAVAKVLVGVVGGDEDPLARLFQDLAATPGALEDPHRPALEPPERDTAQEEHDRAMAYKNVVGRPRLIKGEVEDSHTVHVRSPSTAIPKHIREALADLL